MNNSHWKKYGLIALACVSSTACTDKYQAINATIEEAIYGFDDANKSKDEILSLPYASSSIRIGDGAELFMVLGFAEPAQTTPGQTQLKWISQDYGMLVTQNGRLVKTLRLPSDNLSGVTANSGIDPLTIPGKKPDAHNWKATYDWQPDFRFNYPAEIQWKYVSEQTVHSTAWTKNTLYYKEFVSFPELDWQIVNHFWIDKKNHQVVKSIQSIGPDMPEIEITFLKPFGG